MKTFKKTILIIFLLTVSVENFGQDTIPPVDNYLQLAAENNPGLKAAYTGYLASLEKIPQLGALPDPTAAFSIFTRPMALMNGNELATIQLMQMFPWFGTLKDAKNEGEALSMMKFQNFLAVRADLFFRVRSAWYKLLQYKSEISLLKDNVELLESLETMATVRFGNPSDTQGTASGQKMVAGSMQNGMKGNSGNLQDVLRIRMEILDLKNRIENINDQAGIEEVELNSLLNRDPNAEIITGDSLTLLELPVNKLALADSILKNNPLLSSLDYEADSYSYRQDKAKRQGMPSVGLGLGYMLIAEQSGSTSTMNGMDMLMPMITLSVPVYRGKYKAMQNEARLMGESVLQQNQDARNDLVLRSRIVLTDLADAERRVKLYKEQLELAEKTAGLLLSGFSSSQNTLDEVLRMQQKVVEYGIRHIDAVADYNITVALADKLMNTELIKN